MGADIIERQFTITISCYDKKINTDAMIEKLKNYLNKQSCIEGFHIDEI